MCVKRLHATLPIFQIAAESQSVLYTPGYLALVNPSQAQVVQAILDNRTSSHDRAAQQIAAWLQTTATQLVADREHTLKIPFRPVNLTAYLSNQCQLHCAYCYVFATMETEKLSKQGFPVIDERVVEAAARLVVRNCAEQGRPFQLVIHGGGEPTLQWEILGRIEKLTRQIAALDDLEWRGYIATNGVLSEQKTRWLAQHFNRIGLSCDGPPDIQNRQRPLRDGSHSSEIIEQTARILKEAGGQFVVRTTITPDTVERQTEIVAYLHDRLSAEEIRFEPVYEVRGCGRNGFKPTDAAWFVGHFLRAQAEAQKRGILLTFSGVRLDELHGSYCDILRETLHVNPNGKATACFFSTSDSISEEFPLEVGGFDAQRGEFLLHQESIEAHRRSAGKIPESCHECIAGYHCARGCPEFCRVVGQQRTYVDSFRCQVNRQLTVAWILNLAQHLEQHRESSVRPSTSVSRQKTVCAQYLDSIPPTVDVAAIMRQWEAVTPTYQIEKRHMPAPVWAKCGFEHDGAEAWQWLSTYSPENPSQPMSIYIHVPFCDRRCRFCDCHAMPLSKRHKAEEERRYIRALSAEIDAWSQIPSLAHRPVTTVHFGGGTPNYLSPSVLEEILQQCQKAFRVTQATEWALESSTSLLTSEHLRQLKDWNFRRLHVGVQTLHDSIRKILGRREPSGMVIRKLVQALEYGYITSVDILYGLPGQTPAGLLHTLAQLTQLGIHGISLYRLNASSRNRRFIERYYKHQQDGIADYVLLQVADQFLIQHGYHKNHFVHYARPEDKNLYYTHTLRQEDLIGLGPTADGVLGPYRYRHPEYAAYIAGTSSGLPVLEGGICESSGEQYLRPLMTALMTGSVGYRLFRKFQCEPLCQRWLNAALLKEEQKNNYVLTANGSWLIDTMLEELLHCQGQVDS